ncbi:hypothetical protein CBL_00298 [Carabus blaptoides fortunei]
MSGRQKRQTTHTIQNLLELTPSSSSRHTRRSPTMPPHVDAPLRMLPARPLATTATPKKAEYDGPKFSGSTEAWPEGESTEGVTRYSAGWLVCRVSYGVLVDKAVKLSRDSERSSNGLLRISAILTRSHGLAWPPPLCERARAQCVSERACGPDKLHLTFSEKLDVEREKTCILYADRGFCYLKHYSNGVQQVHLSSHKPSEGTMLAI